MEFGTGSMLKGLFLFLLPFSFFSFTLFLVFSHSFPPFLSPLSSFSLTPFLLFIAIGPVSVALRRPGTSHWTS
jgi:hypothetical protein